MSDEFYIGYQKKTPRGLARKMRATIGAIVVIAAIAAVALAVAQARQPEGRYGISSEETIRGRVLAAPVPHLVPDGVEKRGFILTGRGKHGVKRALGEMPEGFHTLRGRIIEDGTTSIFEVHDYTPEPERTNILEDPPATEMATLEGELVDSKCFAGAMRPGAGKVHRGCAIACLEGGIPPAVWVEGRRIVFLAGDPIASGVIEAAWAGRRIRVLGTLHRAHGFEAIIPASVQLLP